MNKKTNYLSITGVFLLQIVASLFTIYPFLQNNIYGKDLKGKKEIIYQECEAFYEHLKCGFCEDLFFLVDSLKWIVCIYIFCASAIKKSVWM